MTEMMDVLALFVAGALIGAGGLVGIAGIMAIDKIRRKKNKDQEPVEPPYFSRDQERMDRKIGEKLGEANQLLKKELNTENYTMTYILLHDVKDLIEARAFRRGYDRGLKDSGRREK